MSIGNRYSPGILHDKLGICTCRCEVCERLAYGNPDALPFEPICKQRHEDVHIAVLLDMDPHACLGR